MNSRFALPLTAAVSFTLTCGVLLWNRRDAAPPAGPSVAAAEPAPTMTPLPPAAALRPARAAAKSTAADLRELPIQLTMRALPASDDYFGAVVNTASGSLMIEVAVFSPHSHQTQTERVRLEAGTRAKFGVDDDLVIHAGDRVTLHVGGYEDLVTQLPIPELESGSEAAPAT